MVERETNMKNRIPSNSTPIYDPDSFIVKEFLGVNS
jgi:hypothetical protein